jgi:hypothetical protein
MKDMKHLTRSTISFAIFAALTLGMKAQVITWDSPVRIDYSTMSHDVATNGNYVDALQAHGSYADGTPLVAIPVPNAVTGVSTEFNIYTTSNYVGGNSNTYGDGTFTITGYDDNGGDGSGSDATAYQKVLDRTTYTTTSGTITMNGLTPGDEYQIQIWNSAGFRPTTFTSGLDKVDTNGQYVIGTFTAGAAALGSLTSSDSFTFAPDHGNDAGEINALSLRDLGAVPEPSTYAMLFGGLGALVLISRFRRKLTA